MYPRFYICNPEIKPRLYRLGTIIQGLISFTLLLHFSLIAPPLFSQKLPQTNLVPNHGFEKFSDEPGGWYFSGKDFSRVALYWTSPTAASPDIYSPKVIIPNSWKSSGFGKVKSYEGVSHAGFTVYGCEKGKPHCREYIQVQLTEPLVAGQRYGFSCMLAHLQKSVSVRNVGLFFSDHEIDEATHAIISQIPTLMLNKWIPSDGNWHRWSGHFLADKSSSYLILGNFSTDEESQIRLPLRSDIRFGYYYIDDVRLFKIPPIIPTPSYESPLTDFIPKEGERVNLSRIYFEHDRTDFMPRARFQLDQLYDFLNRYTEIRIEIIGYTDNVGSAEYNQKLSEKRSEAVVKWLVTKGIHHKRLVSSGYGANNPISSNSTSMGRSQNRRVEVKVISL